VVALVEERLEAEVTFRVVPKRDAAFRVVTLVDERLEAEVRLRVVPKIEAAFMVVTLVVERLEDAETFRVVAFIKGIVRVLKENVVLVAFAWREPGTTRDAMLATVMTLIFDVSKFETAPFAALRNPVFDVFVLRTLKKAVLAPRPPVTLAVVNHAFAILEVPKTLRLTRGPNDVIFD
jgi:hypothetical protein